MTVVSKTDTDFVRKLLKDKSGIDLSEDKGYLISSRLLPIARSNSLSGIPELIAQIRNTNNPSLITELVEALTTNETLFFRDNKPFTILQNDVIPHILEHNKTGTINIWCAACSAGQEPYSVAMTLEENRAKLGSNNCKIIGTDIDNAILKKASDGIYNQFEVQRGLPISHLMKYFTQSTNYSEKWEIKQNIRDMVQFKYLNLLEGFGAVGQCDVIFCRNVLIYFDKETKTQILNKIAGLLKPEGVFFMGSSEAPFNFSDKFKIFKDIQGAYQKI